LKDTDTPEPPAPLLPPSLLPLPPPPPPPPPAKNAEGVIVLVANAVVEGVTERVGV